MKILYFYLLLLLFAGCKKEAEATERLSSPSFAAADMTAVEEPATVDDKVLGAASMKKKPDAIEAKIIREADIEFETDNTEDTYSRISRAVGENKGIIQNDNQGKNEGALYRELTIRVPNSGFDGFIAAISKGVTYFDRKEISAKDVTEEYIDIDARLKAKRQLESRYLELLKKAVKVSEMLEIETQLSTIREDIEAREGQLRYMQSRISMSTVNIRFYKSLAQENGATVSYGTKIGNALESGFNGISSFFIGMLEIWPFIVILVALFLLIRRRFKKRKSNT